MVGLTGLGPMLGDIIIYGAVLIILILVLGAIAYLAWELTVGSKQRRDDRDDEPL